jgi:uncharacterized protein
MHTLDKQGLRLEQCERCRGIFLDHGELEQILRAEQSYYGGAVPSYGAPVGVHPDSPKPYRGHRDSPRPYGHHPDSPKPYRGHRDSPRPYGHQRRGSFLGDLFG